MMNIRKRDGSLAEFNPQRIRTAINKALVATYGKELSTQEYDSVAESIVDTLPTWEGMSVEEIQDSVVELLEDNGLKDVAQNFSVYRKERAIQRANNISLTSKIAKKLKAENVENSNANVDERSFGGRLGEAANEMAKDFALNYCMSEMSRDNHLNNEIYIHDLSQYALGSHNCLSLPIDHLLEKGFTTRQCDIRPANSVSTAMQLIAVLFQIQSLQQFGGVSATHVDWSMVPYVRKSFWKHFNTGAKWIIGDLRQETDETKPIEQAQEVSNRVYEYALEQTVREVEQAAEALFHNLK